MAPECFVQSDQLVVPESSTIRSDRGARLQHVWLYVQSISLLGCVLTAFTRMLAIVEMV